MSALVAALKPNERQRHPEKHQYGHRHVHCVAILPALTEVCQMVCPFLYQIRRPQAGVSFFDEIKHCSATSQLMTKSSVLISDFFNRPHHYISDDNDLSGLAKSKGSSNRLRFNRRVPLRL